MGVETERKPIMMTWEEHCLRKLEEIGKSDLMTWAKAMGYDNQNSMQKIVRRIKDKLLITRPKRKRYFEVKKE